MSRIDHCSNLIHFTKGTDYESAYQRLLAIIRSGQINCGTGNILGSHCCICFTEAPARCLTNEGQLNAKYFRRYSPFGFEFSKIYIFNNNGRPVLYSPLEESNSENPNLNWRHVTYNPNDKPGIYSDWTWEREWRIRTDSLILDPNHVRIILPNSTWISRFIDDHEQEYHSDEAQCKCKRQATIYTYSDYHSPASCEALMGSCPIPSFFPWILINLNEAE